MAAGAADGGGGGTGRDSGAGGPGGGRGTGRSPGTGGAAWDKGRSGNMLVLMHYADGSLMIETAAEAWPTHSLLRDNPSLGMYIGR